MIKQILEESGVQLSPKLISLGLPPFRVTEVLHLAESLIFKTFQKKVVEGHAADLLGVLNSKRSNGAVAFIQNFIHDRSVASFEKRLQHEYTLELINMLVMNSTFAGQVANITIPYLLDKIIVQFSKTGIDSEQLSSMISPKSKA